MSKTIALVLSSGGARGYAHIGVIEVLEEYGLKIRAIVGSSMGALIGGLYANKTLQEYKDWVLTLDFFDVLKLVDFSFRDAGMIKGDRVFDQMAYLFGDVLIEELPVSFTAVATDLVERREVWFQHGSLKYAIRASIAMPMVFTPIRQGNRILVDGGVLNPLPVAPVMSDRTDLVVAVNVNAVLSKHYPPDLPPAEQEKQDQFQNGLSRFLNGVGWNRRRKEPSIGLSLFEITQGALETMQDSLSRYKMAGNPPDVLIETPADACAFYDFHKAYDMIQVGRTAAQEALENLAKKGKL